MPVPIDFDVPEDPRPRSKPLPFYPIAWPIRCSLGVRAFVPPPTIDFADLLEARRSCRSIDRSPLRETLNLLVYGHHQRGAWGGNPRRSIRPSHSAGALHPVELLLVAGSLRNHIFRIEPVDGVVQSLHIANRACLTVLNAKLAAMLPNAQSGYVVLLADRCCSATQYSSARQLIWRDAGALMQTLHLCATAHRMALCPAGIGGSEIRDAIFGQDGRLEGVGVAVLGRASEKF